MNLQVDDKVLVTLDTVSMWEILNVFTGYIRKIYPNNQFEICSYLYPDGLTIYGFEGIQLIESLPTEYKLFVDIISNDISNYVKIMNKIYGNRNF